jgi:uncharacterized protein
MLAVVLQAIPLVRGQSPSDRLLNQLKPQGLVNDYAGLLSDNARADLEIKLRAVEAKTTSQISVVTIKSLEGEEIDDFASRLFERWGIGGKGVDNGVLILVALNDRKARIEVGDGLEAIMPDALAGRILRERLFPAFRRGAFSEGLVAGALQVAEVVEKHEPQQQANFLSKGAPLGLGQQVALALFLSPFAMIGGFLCGLAIGSPNRASQVGTRILIGLVGSVFALAGLGISYLKLSLLGSGLLSFLAISMIRAGLAAGRRDVLSSPSPSYRRRGRSVVMPTWLPQGGDWVSRSGGGFGGGSSSWGGFGGGSSSGGGASGGW